MVEADAARRACEAAEAGETKARQVSALLQGRVEELERRLLEHEDSLASSAASAEAARREYQTEAREHAETKQALTRALDDLDAWEEERATLMRRYSESQGSWETERQGLLDTEVALRVSAPACCCSREPCCCSLPLSSLFPCVRRVSSHRSAVECELGIQGAFRLVCTLLWASALV